MRPQTGINMGFGTLLFGYCLILNLNYRFTDAAAAVIMLYALYKLSGVNRSFKLAAVGSAALTAFGIYELVIAAADMLFAVRIPEALDTASVLLRYFILGTTSTLMLLGMRDVCREVGLGELSKRCSRLSYATVTVYAFYMLMELDLLASIVPSGLFRVMVLLALLSVPAVVILNLVAIYGCYSKICMPEDKGAEAQEKKSRFEFVNKFREHEEERQREYAEYRLDKMKKKAEKAKQKQKEKDENNKK